MTPLDAPPHELAAAAFGVDLTRRAKAELAAYRGLLERRAAPEGLMSARAVDRLEEHLVDSLSVCSALPAGDSPATCLDVGSGAGLPGVVVAIARPDISLTLLEPAARRSRFLSSVAALLPDRRLTVVTARAELAARGPLRESFDYAVARAVAPMDALAELALPFVRVGGRFLAMKTAAARGEIEQAAYAVEACGGTPVVLREVAWEGLRMPRLLVVVEKAQPTPDHLPRRDGLPRRRPLSRPSSI